jgi:hypothetical protein
MAAAAKLRVRKTVICPERSSNRWIALDWNGLASHVTFLQRFNLLICARIQVYKHRQNEIG